MALPQTITELLPPQANTISMADAAGRTAVWRSVLCNLINSGTLNGGGSGASGGAGYPEADLPKCIHIPFEELLELADDFRKAGYGLSGVRLYLTFDNNNIDNNFRITGFLVPTVNIAALSGVGDQLPKVHNDFIIPVRMKQPKADLTDDLAATPNDDPAAAPADNPIGVSIYDFTLPCPTYCSGASDTLTGTIATTTVEEY